MASSPLRIAVWFNLPAGGARRALSYQIRGLLERGHHVEAWSAPLKDPDRHALPAGVIQHIHPFDDRHSPETHRPPAAKTPWKRIRDFARFHEEWLAGHDRFARMCAQEINAGGFHVLLAHNCWQMNSPFIGRHVNVPKVLYLHEPHRSFYEAQDGSIWLPYELRQKRNGRPARLQDRLKDFFDTQGRRLQIAAELENARSFDRILVNSYYSKESVLRAYGLEAKVCQLGIDTSLFHPTGSPKERVVVTLGHVGRAKNILFLIESIARLGPKKPPLILASHWIDQEYRAECDSTARDLGVELIYRENLPDSELVELLSKSCAFLFAPYLEPFGLAPLEANACGTAAIAVAEGGPRESIVNGANGVLIERDPQEMSEALMPFLTDLDYAESFGRNAREHVELNWNLKAAEGRLEKQLLSVALGVPESARTSAFSVC